MKIKLNEKLNELLIKNKITSFTQIQQKAIPEILKQKPVLGVAQTGTGKTLAFVLPIVNALMKEKVTGIPKALVIAPTRELAKQIHETFVTYTHKTGIVAKLFVGGESVPKDIMICQKQKFDIVVANPGRLMDLVIDREVLDLTKVKFVVLDEADQMLDMGFAPDINLIYKKGIRNHVEQSLMFSATMPKEVIKLATKYLGHDYEEIVIEPEFNVFDKMEQKAYLIKPKERIDAITAIVNQHLDKQAIIFTRTRREARNLELIFNKLKINATSIHSEKSQAQRKRIIERFKDKSLNFLIATDVMARGIDIKNLPLVINFNLPDANETYVHRVGRTARAGAKGLAVSLVTRTCLNKIKQIERITNYPIEIINFDDSQIEINFRYEHFMKDKKDFDDKPKRSSRTRRETNQDYANKHFVSNLKEYRGRSEDDGEGDSRSSRTRSSDFKKTDGRSSRRRTSDSSRRTDRSSRRDSSDFRNSDGRPSRRSYGDSDRRDSRRGSDDFRKSDSISTRRSSGDFDRKDSRGSRRNSDDFKKSERRSSSRSSSDFRKSDGRSSRRSSGDFDRKDSRGSRRNSDDFKKSERRSSSRNSSDFKKTDGRSTRRTPSQSRSKDGWSARKDSSDFRKSSDSKRRTRS